MQLPYFNILLKKEGNYSFPRKPCNHIKEWEKGKSLHFTSAFQQKLN